MAALHLHPNFSTQFTFLLYTLYIPWFQNTEDEYIWSEKTKYYVKEENDEPEYVWRVADADKMGKTSWKL